MKTTKYIMAAALAISLTACDDWLGNKPKGYTIPETFSDYQKLMNSQYLYNELDGSLEYLTDDPMMTAQGEANVEWFEYLGLDEAERNMFSFQHGDVYSPGNSDPIWDGSYENIFTYNAVANNVLASTGSTDAEKRRLHAEALLGRAFNYLCLVNIYGKHYDPATAESDFGVPLVLSEEVGDIKYHRNTVAEVYSKIEADLLTAAEVLKDNSVNSFTASRMSCYSLLSRMYLYMGKYDEALNYANKVIQSGQYSYVNYNDYKQIDGTQWRCIVHKDTEVQLPDGQYGFANPEQIFSRFMGGHTFNGVCESDDLKKAFDNNADKTNGQKDMREELFFRRDSMDRGAGFEYFPGYTIYAAWIYINVGTSLPEIVLNAAECEARVGSTAKAIDLLNQLRKNRIGGFKPYDPSDFSDRKTALKAVLNERRAEFAMIGYMRLVDLKRLNREADLAKTVVHKVGTDVWELPANDNRYIMPIPTTVLEFNPDIPQYER